MQRVLSQILLATSWNTFVTYSALPLILSMLNKLIYTHHTTIVLRRTCHTMSQATGLKEFMSRQVCSQAQTGQDMLCRIIQVSTFTIWRCNRGLSIMIVRTKIIVTLRQHLRRALYLPIA